jgi:hypothetical protein
MLVMLFAFAVVAVDVGRLAFTANEVQAVADIAATAGATAAFEGGNPVNQARDVVALNTVDGHPASIAASDVIPGRYDLETKTFTAGATPTNAVRANAMATVDNILAMVFGTASTTVEKTSTAVVATVSSGTPTLPLAIGECLLEGLCATCLPTLTQAPNPDNNSAWTGFFNHVDSGPDVTNFMPETCGGGGAAVPELRVGDTIQLGRLGRTSSLPVLNAVNCQLNAGQRDFVIPVVGEDEDPDDNDDESGSGDGDSGSDDGEDDGPDDDSYSGDGEGDECDGALSGTGHVVGFVTVHIDSVVTTSFEHRHDGINLHGIPNAALPGTPGGDCENCRSGHAVIVN